MPENQPAAGLVLVIRDERYGSAIMRGIQQAQTLAELGVPVRLLSMRTDASAIRSLRDQTVVLVKDAVHEDALVISLATGNNRLVWDMVDFFAHKPILAGPTAPSEFLHEMAISACLDHALVMTAQGGELLADALPRLANITRVDHQVDRMLAELEPSAAPSEFGLAYLGAEENIPEWVPKLPSLSYLLTSQKPFTELIPKARALPFHVDFRNPLRDRRDLKPWTKAATALHLGATPIAEATDANVDALGVDYPLLFDGGRPDFVRAISDAERIWNDGGWPELYATLEPARIRSHPEVVARHMADALGVRVKD